MYANNELMFPHHVIPSLQNLRGEKWSALVKQIIPLGENHESTLALMLMMIRLNGCLACETDSFRAMRGCAPCAIQTLRRYKGSDDELIEAYESALHEVRVYARNHPKVHIGV
ncbi:MAG: hypothetical protein IAE80_03810 [Anaerolinea sp.]|nr:hypothetical protein [Anaerolinea sp.]